MLSREIRLLAQLVNASAGFTWNKESAGAIHDTLMLMAASAEKLERGAATGLALEVPTTATLLELAETVVRARGLGCTAQQALSLASGFITLSANKQVTA